MPNLLLFADDAARIAAYSYADNKLSDVDGDLSPYGPGKSYIRTDRRMRRNGFANNWSSMRSQNSPFFGGVPQIAFSASRLQRGEVLPSIASTSVGIASYPVLSAVLNPTIRFLLPSLAGPATPLVAGLLAVIPSFQLGNAAAQAVRYVNRFGYRLRHIEQGGDYTDTATAYNLRMLAISDMSSAMSYSRRWLGNEALFMR